MKFEEINKLFDPKGWDVGVINKEELDIEANENIR